jgi:hypothetical protein
MLDPFCLSDYPSLLLTENSGSNNTEKNKGKNIVKYPSIIVKY